MTFDFGATGEGKLPEGFYTALFGAGKPAEWQVFYDKTSSKFQSRFTNSVASAAQAVLAQLSRDTTDERFPLCIYNGEIFGDFTFSAKVKIMEGNAEQMAGLIFRAQDATNFYYFRACAKEGTVRFLKVVNGQRSVPIGDNVPVTRGEWHEIVVECKGNSLRCSFDGHALGGANGVLNDNTFSFGHVGFLTKSDSLVYFADAKIVYVPRVSLAQTIVAASMKKYNRLRGLSIYLVPNGANVPQIIASSTPTEMGKVGGDAVKDVLARGKIYQLRSNSEVTVYMPLHDNNGDIAAVGCVTMETFLGQTEQNAIVRAMPIIKEMEARFHMGKDLLQ